MQGNIRDANLFLSGVSSIRKSPKMRKEKFSAKDVLVLGSVYVGLLSLVLVLPENNPLLSGFVLGATAIVSMMVVQHIK